MSRQRPSLHRPRSFAFALVAALLLVTGSSVTSGRPTLEAATPPCQGSYCATFSVTLSGAGAGTYATADGFIACRWAGGVQAGRCSHQYVWSYTLGPTLAVNAEVTPSASSDGCDALTRQCNQFPQSMGFILSAGSSASDSVVFRRLPQTLWVTVAGVGAVTVNPGGTVCRTACSANLPYGTEVTLTATPDPGTAFISWTGSCAGQGAICSLTLIMDATTEAAFGPAPPSPLPVRPTVTSPRLQLLSPGKGATSLPVRVDWSGSPGTAPIVAFDLQLRTGSGPWTDVALARPLSTTAVVSLKTGAASQLRVRARDSAAQIGEWASTPSRTALAYQESSSAVTYAGSWSTKTSSSAWAGHLRATRTARRSATFRFTGSAVALVAPRGPTEGSARIAIDGVVVKTISLYSGTSRARQVVYQKSFASSGRHAITITVVGTSGHPEVDIDGFAVLR